MVSVEPMPGIHLYSSNRLEILAHTFGELLRSDPLPPLQKETVLVQSRGMARWLAMETASRLTIWANCDCPFPNTFINKTGRQEFLVFMSRQYLNRYALGSFIAASCSETKLVKTAPGLWLITF